MVDQPNLMVQTQTGNYEIDLNNVSMWYGTRFKSNEHIRVGRHDNRSQKYKDCVFTIGAAKNMFVEYGADEFVDCTIDSTDTVNTFQQPLVINQTPEAVRFVHLVYASGGGMAYRENAVYLWSIGGPVEFIGSDFSALTRNPSNLIAGNGHGFARFIDCKLPPNYVVMPATSRNQSIEVIRCDGTDDFQTASSSGDLISEATIVRTGGAP